MILVTGGAGYVGSLLVQELLSLGERVRVADIFWFGNPFGEDERLELLKADARSLNESCLDEVTAVVHLAGLSNDVTADFAPGLNSESNMVTTRRLAQLVGARACREKRVIKFIFASTCSVYYRETRADDADVKRMFEDLPVAPTANYSKTKRLAEIELLRVAEQYPYLCPVILRKGTIFGLAPRMRFDLVVNTFTLHAWRRQVLTVHGHGEAWRPLLHIRDAVDAYVHLLWAPADKIRGETFNVVHKNYRILELAHWVAEVLDQHYGVKVQVKRDRSATNGSRSYFVDSGKIAKTLGFRAERGTSDAVLAIWDALVREEFGKEPEKDSRYFNITWLKEKLFQGAA